MTSKLVLLAAVSAACSSRQAIDASAETCRGFVCPAGTAPVLHFTAAGEDSASGLYPVSVRTEARGIADCLARCEPLPNICRDGERVCISVERVMCLAASADCPLGSIAPAGTRKSPDENP